ncbi:Hypothetical_protein [Hexamita inflata]|uniref:Hypothetical_protein n=1 Tax=Hexamita inflata TaxID=28002 RepID=A0AA86TK06_9EUKA|nr:Hypothetical protein HINF_LOCUS7350 [Hexamita inflata]CAI9972099.1 Hypothetical protein HINF_LOCUS59744 [Hexamita inflata]
MQKKYAMLGEQPVSYLQPYYHPCLHYKKDLSCHLCRKRPVTSNFAEHTDHALNRTYSPQRSPYNSPLRYSSISSAQTLSQVNSVLNSPINSCFRRSSINTSNNYSLSVRSLQFSSIGSKLKDRILERLKLVAVLKETKKEIVKIIKRTEHLIETETIYKFV